MKNGLHTSMIMIMMLITLTMPTACAQARAIIDPTDMTGRVMFEGLQLNQINPDMDMAYPERLDQFLECRDVPHDMPDWRIDSRMNRTASMTGMPDRFAHDRLADKDMAYQQVNPDMDMAYPERLKRFSGYSGINHDVSDYFIDSRMNRTMSRTGTSDRSAPDRLAGKDMAYQQVNPDMDVTHPERFERSQEPDIRHDMPDELIDSRIDRTMLGKGTPDRSVHDRLADKDMAYQKVSDSDIPLVMSETTSSECSFTYGITAGDLNGDDRDDVLVFSGTYNSTTYAYTFESVSAVNGDGAELWSQSIVYEAGWIDDIPAYPVGDLDGDGKDDVIVESGSYDSVTDEYTASVYARRGYDGHQFWSQSITGESVSLWVSYCDLDGDGKDDVIVESRSYDSATDEYTASVYTMRGYDGHQFWSQSVTGDGWDSASLWADSYCDLDGDGKDDVIVESGSYDSVTDEYTASVYARRGYDGHQFWSQSITGESVSLWVSYCDLDGDGKDDVIVESRSYDSATDEYTASVYTMRGYDGHQFWSQSVTGDGWDSASLWADSYCDLDGDGKDDVIVESGSYDSVTDEYTASVYARRGYDGHQFWSQSVTGPPYGAYMWVESYCDLDGDDLDDVIVESRSYNSTTDEYTYSVHVRQGYTGTEFWNQSITGDYVYMDAYPCGDLDGDDLDDVIVESGSYNPTTDEETYSVYARRGYDGTEFWNQSITDDYAYMYAYPCGDLDGDDKDDVIVESGSYNSTTDEYTYSVHVRQGYTGTEFWNQSIAGEDVSMYVRSYCDLDGDDLDDVIVRSRSYNSTADEYTYSVHARQGYTGTEFWSQSITDDYAYMYAYLCGDLDGDDLDDVIVRSRSYNSTADEYTYSVHARQGYTGTEFWSQSITDDYAYMYAYLCGDLDGDDLDDVIVESRSYNSTTDEETASVYARRGYNGTEFWSQSITDYWADMYVYSYCDLDGDDLDDVIVESRSYNSTTDEETYSVYARRGYDGTEFWNQSITDDYTYMYAYLCGDLDGDDLDDVIVESGSYNSTTDEETYSVYARRGYDGTEFWSQSITGEDAYIDAYPCGDLDGDDKDDVIVESWSYNSTTDEETYSVHVRQGDTGTEFWSQSITGEDVWMEIDYYNWYYWHQDFDGDNLNDVLITTGIFIGYEGVPTKVCAVKGNDGTSLWCSPLIASVEISPPSADLLINETQQFTATCNDTRNNPMSGCALTWTCDSPAVGTINSTGLFTAGGVGTATVTVTALYEGKTMTDTAVVNVSATETVYVDGDNFTAEVGNITMNGTFTQNVTGNITMTLVPDPEVDAGNYQLITGNDVALMGLNVTPDAAIAEQLADGNGTIRIEICYNETELASKGISLSTLALWRFNESTNEWVKMVKGTLPCVDNGITGNCVWIEVNNLSTFALVGTKTARGGGGGGSGGTYPPGWGTTPAVTATKAPTATTTATAAPSGKYVTPTPKKPVTAGTAATAAEGATAGAAAKKNTPGFEAVFAIAGLLTIAYAMMRRRG